MIKIGVIGHTGRLGKPLMQILQKHPEVEVVYTESRREGVYGNPSDTELVFLALPYGESQEYLSQLGSKRIIDLSIDHRADDEWVYGLSELFRDKIADAQYVANPGCYATSVILGLAPLKGRVRDVQIVSTSGISGAGKEVQQEDNFFIYKDEEGREHQQIPEIEKALGLNGVLFIPQRGDNTDRGITTIIFGSYDGQENLRELYEEFYRSEPFVRIRDTTDGIKTRNVNRTNYCDIKVDKHGDVVIVRTALDNLIKGGSGQAVQNFNLMYGFDQRTALQ